jgi:hypothetical protein
MARLTKRTQGLLRDTTRFDAGLGPLIHFHYGALTFTMNINKDVVGLVAVSQPM